MRLEPPRNGFRETAATTFRMKYVGRDPSKYANASGEEEKWRPVRK
jgi:hypothetical protein